jgi:hypothetical protein
MVAVLLPALKGGKKAKESDRHPTASSNKIFLNFFDFSGLLETPGSENIMPKQHFQINGNKIVMN